MHGYMTTGQVCELLGISEDTALRWFKSGELPAVKIGGRWFVPAEEFQSVMKGAKNDGREDEEAN